jgi:hypothetical protein
MIRAVLLILLQTLVVSLPAPSAALTIVGFSRSGKHVLFRSAEGRPRLHNRNGRPVDLPAAKTPSDRQYRHGRPVKAGQLRLGANKRSMRLKRKGVSITVWKEDAARDCALSNLGDARLSRNRSTLAVVLKQKCEPKERPVVISLHGLALRLARQGVALARKGRRKLAAQSLKQAGLLHPGSSTVLYNRARVAALTADQHEAIRLLKQLKARRAAGARRLFVKAQFDRDFRLIEGSAAFKNLFRF